MWAGCLLRRLDLLSDAAAAVGGKTPPSQRNVRLQRGLGGRRRRKGGGGIGEQSCQLRPGSQSAPPIPKPRRTEGHLGRTPGPHQACPVLSSSPSSNASMWRTPRPVKVTRGIGERGGLGGRGRREGGGGRRDTDECQGSNWSLNNSAAPIMPNPTHHVGRQVADIHASRGPRLLLCLCAVGPPCLCAHELLLQDHLLCPQLLLLEEARVGHGVRGNGRGHGGGDGDGAVGIGDDGGRGRRSSGGLGGRADRRCARRAWHVATSGASAAHVHGGGGGDMSVSTQHLPRPVLFHLFSCTSMFPMHLHARSPMHCPTCGPGAVGGSCSWGACGCRGCGSSSCCHGCGCGAGCRGGRGSGGGGAHGSCCGWCACCCRPRRACPCPCDHGTLSGSWSAACPCGRATSTCSCGRTPSCDPGGDPGTCSCGRDRRPPHLPRPCRRLLPWHLPWPPSLLRSRLVVAHTGAWEGAAGAPHRLAEGRARPPHELDRRAQKEEEGRHERPLLDPALGPRQTSCI